VIRFSRDRSVARARVRARACPPPGYFGSERVRRSLTRRFMSQNDAVHYFVPANRRNVLPHSIPSLSRTFLPSPSPSCLSPSLSLSLSLSPSLSLSLSLSLSPSCRFLYRAPYPPFFLSSVIPYLILIENDRLRGALHHRVIALSHR